MARTVLSVRTVAIALAAALLGVGCQKQEWSLELAPSTSAPVAVTKVSAHRTVAMRVGQGGVKITSSNPNNSVAFDLDVSLKEGFAAGAELATRTACLAGDKVWATHFVGDGGFLQARPGETKHTMASFMPTPFEAGPPSACEVQTRYQPGLVGPTAPQFTPVEVARICWNEAQGLTSGACPPEALPRKIPDVPLVVGPIRASWGGGPGPLGLAAALTLGKGAGPDHDVVVAAACAFEGPPRQSHFTIVERLVDYEPGDSFAVEGTAFHGNPAEPKPARCTIEVRRRPAPMMALDKWLGVSSHCFENGSVRDGACDGLAPGPATLRIDAELRATLERGSHREGPFAIGPDPTSKEWDPILASLKLSKDEGVNIVAPASMAQAGLMILLDALKAQRLPVSLQVTKAPEP